MPKPLKLLIVEDNPADAEMALMELRNAGFEPDWVRVDTEETFLEHLGGELDLVLSDYQMPLFNGLRALELLEQSRLDVPFILLSGTIGEDIAVSAIKKGATDYLLKDRLSRLGPAVLHAMAERRMRHERRRAANAAQHELAELRVLFDLIPAMIWFKDTENRILRVNQRAADNAGMAVEEMEGRPSLEIYPDHAAQFYQEDLPVIRTGVPEVGRVFAVTSPEGGKLWVQTDKVPVRAKDGKIVGLVVMAKDVTESKREDASRDRLVAIVEATSDLVSVSDPVGRLLYLNRAGRTLLGVGSDEDMSKTDIADFVPDPANHTSLLIGIPAAVQVGMWSGEVNLANRNGQQFPVSQVILAHKSVDGKLEFLSMIMRDVSERSRSTEALRASEQRFRTLFDQAAVGVALADATTGRLVQVNQRFADIVGRSRKELEQLTLGAITHPDDLAQDSEMMLQIREGTIREAARDKRYVRKDNTEVWVNQAVSPTWARGEKNDLCIAVVQDITERKKLEEQFRQTQKMEAIGTLAGGIAHDFNNILAAINGYTEFSLTVLKGNPDVRKYLGSVLQASSRAADLVRQILTFSRQQPPERRPVQLLPIVAEAFSLLRATIPTTIEFDLLLASDAPTVLADIGQVHQILMNLGTNAWYAMKDHTGRMQVKLERFVVVAEQAISPRLRPGVYARLSVRDTGCGMDRAVLSRIFEPFYTTKPVGEGTGLGLAVVHGIMDSHDGMVTVDSQVGEGTVFRLYFPENVGEVSVNAAELGEIPRGNGERILVVDDEEVLAQLCETILTALGYQVEITTRPEEALEWIRADPQRFALVATDQTMPRMTGLHLASQLRVIRPELPIILMTGFASSLTDERVEEEGIGQILLKPATIRSLGTAVHAALAVEFVA